MWVSLTKKKLLVEALLNKQDKKAGGVSKLKKALLCLIQRLGQTAHT